MNIIGKLIKGKYQVEAPLGRGGMADVYQVWDRQRQTYLAMKVLRSDLATDLVFIQRFQREARNLAKLQHPNIVRFYGLEQEGRISFLLMEYIEGMTLQDLLFEKRKPLEKNELLRIMRPVCSALYYAHQKGIIHCDMKSSNILIDKSGKVYVSDFGIARQMEASTASLATAGSPAYMAPEQLQGRQVTPQTDIYALGVVLYEMMSGGWRPFDGQRANFQASTREKIAWEHQNLEPIPIRRHNKSIPAGIEHTILKCLEKDPAKRFRDTNILFQELSRAMDSTPEERGSHYPTPQPESREFRQTESVHAQPQAQTDKKNTPILAICVIVLIFLFVIISGSLLLRSSIRNHFFNEISSSNIVPITETSPIVTLVDKPISATTSPDIFENSSSYAWNCLYQFNSGDVLSVVLSTFGIEWDEENQYQGYESCMTNGNYIEECDTEIIYGASNDWMTREGEWIMVRENNPENNKDNFSPQDCVDKGGFVEIIDYQPPITSTDLESEAETESAADQSICIGTANDNNINLRNTPDGLIIGCCLRKGEEVELLNRDEKTEWLYVHSTTNPAHEGWVPARYIDRDISCSVPSNE